jgi:hypothetical protein
MANLNMANLNMAHLSYSQAIADLEAHGVSAFAAKAAIWLEACEYPGLKTLLEGLSDAPVEFVLKRGVIGMDLQNISCVQIGPEIVADVRKNGRVMLRNVRHGLFLLPASVEHNFGIGCPVDPGFPYGMERTKNPYTEKLDLALANGINVDDAIWHRVMERS